MCWGSRIRDRESETRKKPIPDPAVKKSTRYRIRNTGTTDQEIYLIDLWSKSAPVPVVVLKVLDDFLHVVLQVDGVILLRPETWIQKNIFMPVGIIRKIELKCLQRRKVR
jgi:hypothetical protein